MFQISSTVLLISTTRADAKYVGRELPSFITRVHVYDPQYDLLSVFDNASLFYNVND